ncbi:MAG: hypothetical protein IKV62_00730 [Bacteroidales bacterium]|nr:hypothetical protein [Bacteroidales bacterium]
MNVKRIISSFLTVLAALTAKGQELTDGISGRDLTHGWQYIQAFSPQSDTCLVMTDSLGRFEIDPDLMNGMRGNVYLKPMITRPKPKLVLDSPFDSIDVYRQGRSRDLVQNRLTRPDEDYPVFQYGPGVIVLDEAVVKARRRARFQDKVLGELDSLTILDSPEWVCVHGDIKYINNYLGFTHHPGNGPFDPYLGERLVPKRGETYRISILVLDNYPIWWRDDACHYGPLIYGGPYYTEEDLLEMYGMSKAQGYHPVREFYEPDEKDLASPAPDYRNLLQWRPTVLTDENGGAEITFGASDVNTEFIGVIEGLDGLGLVGCQTFTFRVFKQ